MPGRAGSGQSGGLTDAFCFFLAQKEGLLFEPKRSKKHLL
jgi:hypothetical protein